MSRVSKKFLCVFAGLLAAVGIFCTGTLAFGSEASIDKFQEILSSLYSNSSVVNQDVYGVIDGEYAIGVTDTDIQDSAVDIINSDGSTKYHTSTALTKPSGDDVWSDYVFSNGKSYGSTVTYPLYPETAYEELKENNFLPVVNKTNNQIGGIDRDGQTVINFGTYDCLDKTGNVFYGYRLNDEDVFEITLFDRTDYHQIQTVSIQKGSYGYLSITGYQKYISIVANGSTPYSKVFKYENSVLSECDDTESLVFDSDDTSNYLKYMSDGSLILNNDGSEITLDTFTSVSSMRFSSEGFISIYGKKTAEQVQDASYYYFKDGTSITDILPSGYSLFFVNGDKFTARSSTENKTCLISKDGTVEKTVNAYLNNQTGNYCLAFEDDETNLKFEAYDLSLNYYKKFFEIAKPADYWMYTFSNNDYADYSSTCGYTLTIMRRSEESSNDSDRYYFDETLNQLSSIKLKCMYTMLDGTKIYRTYDGASDRYKFIGEDGNPIVKGGYTLDTYQYASCDSNTMLQHGNQDVWWAVDSNGKRGAVDSYGSVVVPFVYDRIRDYSDEDSAYAMGYKDGKWEFIRITPVPSPVPVVDSVSDSTIKVSWPEVEGATKYAVSTLNDDGKTYTTYTSSLIDTTYTISNLQCGKTYKILVQAYSAGKWSSNSVSKCIEGTTKSVSPVAEAEATGDGQVTITWEAVDGATKYAVSEVLGSDFRVIDNNINELTYVVDDLSNKVEHTFIVQAFVNGAWSKFGPADYVSATPDGNVKPYDISHVSGSTSIQLTWGKVSGATAYAVSIKKADGSFDIKTTTIAQPAKGVNTVTYTAEGLANSTQYTFLVQAFVNGKWNSYTEADYYSASTKSIKPVAAAEATENDGEIKVSWQPVENATQYACSEYLGDGKFDIHIVGTDLQYIASDLVAQREHKFLVQAYVAGTWSSYTEADYVGAIPTGDIKPTDIDTTPGATSIQLDWDKVPGATKYAVALRNADKTYKLLSTSIPKSDNPTFTATGLKDSTEYTFLVQAFVDGSWSRYVEEDHVVASTISIKPQASAVATENDGEIKVSWQPVENATQYACSEYLGDGKFDIHIVGTDLQYIASDLVAQREHKFLVQAYVAGSWSSYTEQDYVGATPTGSIKPTNITATSGATSIQLDWAKVPGATKYAVALRNADKTYKLLSTSIPKSDSPTFTASGLKDSTEYTFLVQAFVDGSWSRYVEDDHIKASTISIKPQATAEATQNDGEIKVSWLPVENATQYACSEYLGDGKFDIHIVGTDLQYIASDLVAQREHKFLVQAYVAGSWSSYTEEDFVGAIPTGPVKPVATVTSTGETTVAITWTAVTGTEQYAASISADGGSTFKSYFIDKGTFTYTFYNLTPNTSYKILIQSKLMGKWNPYTAADLVDAHTLQAQNPVAVHNTQDTTNPTLTFYYDRADHSSEGTVYAIDNTKVSEWPSWSGINANVKTVNFDSSFAAFRPISLCGWFSVTDYATSILTTINSINNLNTSVTKDMSYCFHNCKQLASLDLSNFDTTNVTNMSYMFSGCKSLSTLDVTSFRGKNLEWLTDMFVGCSGIKTLDLSHFDTAKVKDFHDFLSNCTSLETVNLSGMSFASALYLDDFFFLCKSLKSADLSMLSGDNVLSLHNMFYDCYELTSVSLPKLTSGSVRDIASIFAYCTKLTSFDFTNINTQNVTVAADAFTYIPVASIDFSKYGLASLTHGAEMFDGCSNLTNIYCNTDLRNILQSSNLMFAGCTKLPHFDNNKLDKTYACPDNGTIGYFTPKA